MTMTGSSAQVKPGMETLEEIKEKDLFFSNLEKKAEGEGMDVDYGKLNEEFGNE